jgi:hypothetical protein
MRWHAAILAVGLFGAAPAHAGQVCAWLVESNKPDDVRDLALWLQSDSDIDFFLKIAGKGIVTESMTAHSPSTATFVLHAGEADKPWGFGSSFEAPGTIDIIAELHVMPTDIFSDAPTPLLTAFTFHRDVPAGETTPSAVLARRQCKTVQVPER